MDRKTERRYASLSKDSMFSKEITYKEAIDFLDNDKEPCIEDLPKIERILSWCFKEILEYQKEKE